MLHRPNNCEKIDNYQRYAVTINNTKYCFGNTPYIMLHVFVVISSLAVCSLFMFAYLHLVERTLFQAIMRVVDSFQAFFTALAPFTLFGILFCLCFLFTLQFYETMFYLRKVDKKHCELPYEEQ
jgi:hypothetical protein